MASPSLFQVVNATLASRGKREFTAQDIQSIIDAALPRGGRQKGSIIERLGIEIEKFERRP